MGKVKKLIIEARMTFYAKLLLGFSELLTPQSFILFTVYFGEYLLVKFSKHKTSTENETGASVTAEVGEDIFYLTLVNTRNSIVHYDPVHLEECLRELESIDYTEYCPVNSDSIIRHCILVYNSVNWITLKDYLLNA